MLGKNASDLLTQGWYLVARGGDLVLRVRSGMHLGEDPAGELSFDAADAHLLLEIHDDGGLLLVADPDYRLELDSGERTPTVNVDRRSRARIDLPHSTLSLDTDFVGAPSGEMMRIRPVCVTVTEARDDSATVLKAMPPRRSDPHPDAPAAAAAAGGSRPGGRSVAPEAVIAALEEAANAAREAKPASAHAGDGKISPEVRPRRSMAQVQHSTWLALTFAAIAIGSIIAAALLYPVYRPQVGGLFAPDPVSGSASEPRNLEPNAAEALTSISALLESDGVQSEATLSVALQSLKALLAAYPGDPRLQQSLEQLTERLASEARGQYDLGEVALAKRLIGQASTTGVAQEHVAAALMYIATAEAEAAVSALAPPSAPGAAAPLDPVAPSPAAGAGAEPVADTVATAPVEPVAVPPVPRRTLPERPARTTPAGGPATASAAPVAQTAAAPVQQAEPSPATTAADVAQPATLEDDAEVAADSVAAAEDVESAREPAGAADDIDSAREQAGAAEDAESAAAPVAAAEDADVAAQPPAARPQDDTAAALLADLERTGQQVQLAAATLTSERDLRAAGLAVERGVLVPPAQGNAFTIYSRVLASRPDSRPAQDGLREVRQALLSRARTSLEADDLTTALASLDDAAIAGVDSAVIDGLRDEVAARQLRQDAQTGKFKTLYPLAELKAVRQEAPRYPRYAPDGAEGSVDIEMTISETGVVRDVEVIGDPPLYFVRAARRAVTRWRFEPVLADGQPVPVRTAVRLTFRGE